MTTIALCTSCRRAKNNICICENKGADHLHSYQRICFHYMDSTIALFLYPKCDRTGRFLSNLFGNHIIRFSHDMAHLIKLFVGNINHLCYDAAHMTRKSHKFMYYSSPFISSVCCSFSGDLDLDLDFDLDRDLDAFFSGVLERDLE